MWVISRSLVSETGRITHGSFYDGSNDVTTPEILQGSTPSLLHTPKVSSWVLPRSTTQTSLNTIQVTGIWVGVEFQKTLFRVIYVVYNDIQVKM